MVELKPCPFCGGYARIESGGPGCHYVRCDDCGACSDDGSQDRASGLWNTRAERALAERAGSVRTVDDLAQEIRRVDGSNSLGAGALADALMPFLSCLTTEAAAPDGRQEAVTPRSLSMKDGVITAAYDSDEDAQVAYDLIESGFTRPSEQAVTKAGIEAAARHITKWLGFSWGGLRDGRVTDEGFPIFMHSQTGWQFQGGKGDMIDIARAAIKAAMEAGR